MNQEQNNNNSNVEQAILAIAQVLQESPISIQTNPYQFSAYLSGSQSTSAGAYANILFDTELYDLNGNFDAVTNKGRYTAPVTGYYLFNAAVNLTASGTTYVAMKLKKNGATDIGVLQGSISTTAASSGIGSEFGGTKLVYLTAGDYVYCQVYCNGSVTIATGSNLGYFEGFLISKG